MALARWQRTIADNAGNVLPNATIEVRREVPGMPLEPLFSDRDGVAPIANPFNADGNGFAAFHCAGGAFQIVASASIGMTVITQTWRYVGIGTASEVDFSTVIGAGQNIVAVNGRAALKALDTALTPNAYLKEGDRSGLFLF